MDKRKKKILLFTLIPTGVVAITLSVVLPITIIKNKRQSVEDYPTNFDNGELRTILHTDVQKAYLNDKVGNINLYARGAEELSRPEKPTFTWEGNNESSYTVYLSENSDYSNALTYETNENKISFTNLKIDTTYFYKVLGGETVVKEESFTTSSEIIRNMYVSGITNVRDLGGYRIGDKKVNQGLIYRTAKLNKNNKETPENLINEKGINTMLNDMKVKSEIDLRLTSNNEVGGLTEGVGVLGETVKYFQCPMDYEKSFDAEINVEALKKVFSILGDQSNYPSFFHCSIGTDRTGYISWLILASLGVNESYLYRDYLFSNFGKIGSKRNVESISDRYVKEINNTVGNTLKEKATNYLLSKGVKQEHIDTIRKMMLN